MRRIVCPCEDITDREVHEAVDTGHADLESVKRFTGLGTGWCQGRQCLVACARLVAELTGKPPEELGTIVHRPPVSPLPLGLLAGEVDEE